MVHLLTGSAAASDYHNSGDCSQAYMPTSHSHTTSSMMDMSYQQTPSTVCKYATLKKIKTSKNKFFVLHKDSAIAPARIEYYDSESHWNKKKKSKRTIYLRSCFSINAFSDTRVKYGLAIFTKDDSFQIGFDVEQTRDMWLADMRLLSHSSLDQGHSSVEHVWKVVVQTRGMKGSFEGEFKLCLNEQQASMMSKENPEQVLTLPLEVITHCGHKNKYFHMEVNHLAQTGPGEIWMELEDSLIAQHVHRAFLQNLALTSPGEDSFRPISRSLSSRDKKADYCTRLRSGSDAKLRSRLGQTLSKYSPLTLSATNFNGIRRDRSDSIDSHSTTTSLSTDESEHSHNWQSASRSITPDLRPDSQSHYMPMNTSGRKLEDNCSKCLSSTGSLSSETAQDGYADMTVGCPNKPHDRNYNFVYVDMTGSHHLPYVDSLQQENKSDGYIDMTVGIQSSPNSRGYKLKPEPVKCYLSEDGGSCKTEISKTQSSTNDSHTSEYVEMCRRQMLTGQDKSSSAPHLIPSSQFQQQRSGVDLLMSLEFDNRDRTNSLSCTHRPRGSTWSQSIRPRASTTDQKRGLSRGLLHTSNVGVTDGARDYIDMSPGPSSDGYVKMSLDRHSRQRLELFRSESGGEREDENHMPVQLSHSPRIPPLVTQPFPELITASSEDDVSLNSMEDSVSLQSLASSADSMSASSHSSHHSSAFTSSLDAEPYVAMHPSPVPISSNYARSNTHRMLLKPARVTSYIVDEIQDTPKSSDTGSHSDYMEMTSSGGNKHTKR